MVRKKSNNLKNLEVKAEPSERRTKDMIFIIGKEIEEKERVRLSISETAVVTGEKLD